MISLTCHNLIGGNDYIKPEGKVKIEAGNFTGQINITIRDDETFEGIETFSVIIDNSQIHSKLDDPYIATVVIVDDESKCIHLYIIFMLVSIGSFADVLLSQVNDIMTYV